MTGREWLLTAGVLIGGAALAVALLLPGPVRGWIGGGAAFVLSTYAQAFSILALGIAMAQLPRAWAGGSIALFAAGLFIGVAVKDPVLAALVQWPGAFERTDLIAPASCLLAALALAGAGRVQRWIDPAVAALAGAAIGFVAALNDPTVGTSLFVAGAAAASVWLLVAPVAVVPRLKAPHVRIGSRILASWLVAVGLMLGAVRVLERKPRPPVPPAPPPTVPAPARPADRFGPPREPGAAPYPAPEPLPGAERRRLP
jgi:hypothetical protein